MAHLKLGLLFLGVLTSGVYAQTFLNARQVRNAKVHYVAPSQLKTFPVPVVGWRAPGLASPAQRSEVLQKVVYPIINKSDKAIASVIIAFNRDKSSFGLEVYWHNGEFVQMRVNRNKNGQIDKTAYKEAIAVPEHDDR